MRSARVVSSVISKILGRGGTGFGGVRRLPSRTLQQKTSTTGGQNPRERQLLNRRL
jgi:hypothetical protein